MRVSDAAELVAAKDGGTEVRLLQRGSRAESGPTATIHVQANIPLLDYDEIPYGHCGELAQIPCALETTSSVRS